MVGTAPPTFPSPIFARPSAPTGCLGWIIELVADVDTYSGAAVEVGLAADAVQVVGGVEPGQGGDGQGLREFAGLAARLVGYRVRGGHCACASVAA